jgi:hypothetical protein
VTPLDFFFWGFGKDYVCKVKNLKSGPFERKNSGSI